MLKMYMQKKTCVYNVTARTENHRTECLTFSISNKKVIEDSLPIFTRIDNKLKVGCSNISEAPSWTNYVPIAILDVPMNSKMLCGSNPILYHKNKSGKQ